MITKNQAKLVKSLQNKKDRNELGLFLVEGEKSVIEVLKSNFEIDFILATQEFFEKNKDLIQVRCEILTQDEIEKLGTLETNSAAIAIVKQNQEHGPKIQANEIIIALDKVQDPGNLGTIIRIADWYGIKKIIASNDTADFYNSKVIGGSMGSFTRVEVFYCDLNDFLANKKMPIFGAYLGGENVHTFQFPVSGILLMGNESKGISESLEKLVTKKITIPSYGEAESLNVGVATAVILDNWKR